MSNQAIIQYFEMDFIASERNLLKLITEPVNLRQTTPQEPVYLRQATPHELGYYKHVYLRQATPHELECYKQTKPIVVYPTKKPYLPELIRVLQETKKV